MVRFTNIVLCLFGIVFCYWLAKETYEYFNPPWRPGIVCFPNGVQPDTTFDIHRPENVKKKLELFQYLAQGSNVGKARKACINLGNLGNKAECALSVLKKVAASHTNEAVRLEAQKAIDLIKSEIERKGSQ